VARLTHLTLERDVKRIVRAGIRAARFRDGSRGVHAMPVLPDFYASHQWLRELRRWRPGPLVAVDFVVPDDTEVLVGHYAGPEHAVTATQAARIIMDADDPRGYEVVVPRKIEAREVKRVRNVPQVVGWRHSPTAHGTPPCPCPLCFQPGLPGAGRLRRRFAAEMAELRAGYDAEELEDFDIGPSDIGPSDIGPSDIDQRS
jgi:hypothetical protein